MYADKQRGAVGQQRPSQQVVRAPIAEGP
jgi:hypothetical protein